MYRQSLFKVSTRRAFTSAVRAAAHLEEGAYSNLPFKVHNRKIPYGVLHFGFFSVGFLVPFLISWVQLKKNGNI